MAKDPAALLYIDKWLIATKEMKANCRGWFLNLILHQYDKKDLPNDIEELANLADVRFSEFNLFKQEFEQVLKQKFELNENGRLENPFAKEILQKREVFKDKRSNAGKSSYLMRFCFKNYPKEYKKEAFKEFLKENFDYSIDFKNEHLFKQMFEQTRELYINKDKDIIIDNSLLNNKGDEIFKSDAEISFEESGCQFSENFLNNWIELCEIPKWKKKPYSAIFKNIKSILKYEEDFALILVEDSIKGNYQGLTFTDTEEKYHNYLKFKEKSRNQSQSKSQSALNVNDLVGKMLEAEENNNF